jgi:predicted nucleotidyltransferase
MDRIEAISILRSNEAELKRFGVRRLSLFGSMARNTAIENSSDIDVAVELVPGPRGFARLRRLEELRQRLSRLLGLPVDVVEEPHSSQRVRESINRDRIIAF